MSLTDNVAGLLKENPIGTAIGAGVIGVGAGVAVGSIFRKKAKRKTRKTRNKRRRIKHTTRGWSQDRKRKSKQSWEVSYRKRKKRRTKSSRGIKYTKKGQPYKILANGRARFIKKSKKTRR